MKGGFFLDEKILNKYTTWLDKATEDTDLTKELKSIEGNEAEIYERFYRELEFGTGGLRGIIGAGDNRMNIYTVRKATQGLADYLKSRYKSAAVAISFDSRIKSDVFAREAARAAGNGIKVHFFICALGAVVCRPAAWLRIGNYGNGKPQSV